MGDFRRSLLSESENRFLYLVRRMKSLLIHFLKVWCITLIIFCTFSENVLCLTVWVEWVPDQDSYVVSVFDWRVVSWVISVGHFCLKVITSSFT